MSADLVAGGILVSLLMALAKLKGVRFSLAGSGQEPNWFAQPLPNRNI